MATTKQQLTDEQIKKNVQDLTERRPGAFSVLMLDPAGGRAVPSRGLTMLKGIADLSNQNVPYDRQSVIDGVPVISHPVSKDVLLAGLTSNAYHFRAQSVKANYVAGTDYALIPPDATGIERAFNFLHKRKYKKTNAQIDAFLAEFGHGKYFVEHLRTMVFDKAWSGDGFLQLVPDASGKIRKCLAMPSRFMWKRADEKGYIFYNPHNPGERHIAFRDFYAMDPTSQVGDNMVIHIKQDHPISWFYGFPDIANDWSAIAKSVLADEYNEKFYANNAVPQMAVILEGAGWKAGADEVIGDLMRRMFKGSKNAHRTMVIDTGDTHGAGATVRFEKLQMDVKEGAFLEQKKEARAAILTASGVPPAKCGIIESGALAGESTQEQLDDFEDSILRERSAPQNLMDDVIRTVFPNNSLLYRAVGTGSRLTFNQARVDNINLSNGTLTINEVREMRGFDPFQDERADQPSPFFRQDFAQTFTQ